MTQTVILLSADSRLIIFIFLWFLILLFFYNMVVILSITLVSFLEKTFSYMEI